MNNQLRSKHGCWTCRLRKKKCDERRPKCSLCEDLSITCHGYGPKPDWLDGGEGEKAVANGLKQTIKGTSRRRAISPAPAQRRSPIKLIPKPLPGIDGSSSLKPVQTISSSPVIAPASENGQTSSGLPMIISDSQNEAVIFSISAEESMLLMHFLDKIFPLQFPAYEPGLQQGGRGWVLSLLLQTKPLFYAAIALSSYHRRMTLITSMCPPCQVLGIVKQETSLAMCLKEFQRSIKSVNQSVKDGFPLATGLGAVISIIELIFFEVFTGESNTWQVHLAAATEMIQIFHCDSFNTPGHLNLSETSRKILLNDIAFTDESASTVQEVSTFRFAISTILWLDILSSITAGTVPKLFPHHFEILTSSSQTKMQETMGAPNWVALQLGRVASLYAERKRDERSGKLGGLWDGEYRRKGVDIKMSVEFGIAKQCEGLSELQDSTLGVRILDIPISKEDRANLVTIVFGLSTLVYLHLVLHGFCNVEHLGSTIDQAAQLLRSQIHNEMIPVLIPALFILGCVARNDDEKGLFRSIFASSTFREPLFKHRWRVCHILEEVWAERESGFAWDDVVFIAAGVLLF